MSVMATLHNTYFVQMSCRTNQCLKCYVKGKTTIGVGKKENLLWSSGTSIDCVEEFCYLWDMFTSGDGAGEASRVRVRCAGRYSGSSF